MVKELLRAAKARLLETLEVAIAQALATVTAHNAVAWFRHCGYGDTHYENCLIPAIPQR